MKWSVAAWLTGAVATLVGAVGFLSMFLPYAEAHPHPAWEDNFFRFWCGAPYFFWLVLGFNFRHRNSESVTICLGALVSAACSIGLTWWAIEQAATEPNAFPAADVADAVLTSAFAQWGTFLAALCVVTVFAWLGARASAPGPHNILIDCDHEDTALHPVLEAKD
ncbi:MAG: hypothetical protein K2X38_04705 [Gemmataceae bacterium]|nr:hypothetical protein [Gemmataceae bacterium]